ncbi:ABC-type dipeptide/oligopeptide/nickel transport system, permease component [Acetomicrobium mobile DSM 13181]|uniref:ABC-type dipeptide/oligopeptide/nickel transport system, permease component n=1 Tax=Acetomicrobium mobile (strain ATCC BAA-54 / DSM 13181 / JCM 12221 / NGA) TaxID=891968 RepID=I4BZE6_ACEMN|nr:ABC transporter permease [Acetomicrobium mobile]AFM22653.1 ABC-type dipeptide/oligopeptide/nickel transport system, permease component [Acetomicrobium mobile DSM 13181]
MTEKKIKHPAFVIWNQLKKNKIAVIGLIIVSLYVFCAIFAPYISPYDPTKQNLAESFQSPNVRHLLGCDDFGRDILSRIIWGARISLLIQLSSVVLALIIGILLGALGGYYGGKIDEVIMRFMDILLAFPGMLLALAIVAMLGPSLRNLIIAIGVYSVPQFARITRGAVLAVRANEYIVGAKAIGESDAAIILRYVLPNALSPIIVQTTLRMATVLLTASGLGFLGLGVQPPNPEWGTMLSSARMYLRAAPHVAIFPGLAIMITVLGFNFLGDGLQDALNPRLKE